MTRITVTLSAVARAFFFGAATIAAIPLAEARPAISDMSCQAARRFIASRGAAVMTTGPGTYHRIVAADVGCLLGEAPRAYFAPTRDHPQCHIGYICVTDEGQWD